MRIIPSFSRRGTQAIVSNAGTMPSGIFLGLGQNRSAFFGLPCGSLRSSNFLLSRQFKPDYPDRFRPPAGTTEASHLTPVQNGKSPERLRKGKGSGAAAGPRNGQPRPTPRPTSRSDWQRIGTSTSFESPNPASEQTPATSPLDLGLAPASVTAADAKRLLPLGAAAQKQGLESAQDPGTAEAVPDRQQGSKLQQTGKVEGRVVRIMFENETNDYTVARVAPVGVKGGFDTTVTVVGAMGSLSVGQLLKFSGQWSESGKWGRQFVVSQHEELLPKTRPEIIEYLGGGVIYGVGPKTAELIVSHFGEATLDMLDAPSAECQLSKIPGIGKSKAAKIAQEWHSTRGDREAMAFLFDLAVPTAAARRLVSVHGRATEAVVRRDPWRACQGVKGWAFPLVEEVARALGLNPQSPSRGVAAIPYALALTCRAEAHSFVPWGLLRQQATDELASSRWPEGTLLPGRQLLEAALRHLMASAEVVVEHGESSLLAPGARAGGDFTAPREREGVELVPDNARVYNVNLFKAEDSVARQIRGRLGRPVISQGKEETARLKRWIENVELRTRRQLSVPQRLAVEAASNAPLLVLTGGPGVGKTHTTQAIAGLWRSMGKRVQLCAPTGRAAQKLSEMVGREAKTIHRMLKFQGRRTTVKSTPGSKAEGGAGDIDQGTDDESFDWQTVFQKSAQDPLEVDAVVVDEASMLELPLAAALFDAIPASAQILFVGDVDQLPPVGPGQVLKDMIKSEKVPVFRLEEIFRQALTSAIITSAHMINAGKFPPMQRIDLRGLGRGGLQQTRWWEAVDSDCLWLEVAEGPEMVSVIQDAVGRALPALGLNPRADLQTLAPVRSNRLGLGMADLNKVLQQELNPPSPEKPELARNGQVYRLGDRVIQLRNDYELEVFNGDSGTISQIDVRDRSIEVCFSGTGGEAGKDKGDRFVVFQKGKLDFVALAWAITVHKAQGSEYSVVLLTMAASYGRILSRKLLYTGLTRARHLAVIVGSRRAIETAVTTVRDETRFSHLCDRICS